MIAQIPVLYIDLDDTVRLGPESRKGKFVNKPSDVEIFPGVRKRLLAYKDAGWRIIGISNQGGIALGYTSETDVQNCMLKTNHLCGYTFDGILYCPHHPQAKDPAMQRCTCRKPLPGMLFSAVAQMIAKYGKTESYPFSIALLVGDLDTDEQCATAARIKFMRAAEWRKTDAGHIAPVLKPLVRR